MSAAIAQWIRDAIAFAGITQTELARRLTARLGRSFDRAAVNKMALVNPRLGQKRRLVKADELYAIAEITGFAAPDQTLRQVPLLSWVSAGKLVDTGEPTPVADLPLLAFADLGRGDYFALKVAGDSMDRVSPDGSIIIVDRADRERVAGRFYVFARRGEATYKRWRRDPPRLEPFSTNPANEPIFVSEDGFEVVGRVRRTVLDL